MRRRWLNFNDETEQCTDWGDIKEKIWWLWLFLQRLIIVTLIMGTSTTILLLAQIKHIEQYSSMRGGREGPRCHALEGLKQMAAIDWVVRNGTLIHLLHFTCWQPRWQNIKSKKTIKGANWKLNISFCLGPGLIGGTFKRLSFLQCATHHCRAKH